MIGMLGGMSWESSAQYYRLANEMVREQLGGLHSARILLASIDFADVEALQVAGRWDEAGQLLAEAARGLEHDLTFAGFGGRGATSNRHTPELAAGTGSTAQRPPGTAAA